MLDGILGRGFASKCKSLIKQVKIRIDVIRRKMNATEKFLKKDIADLLASGLDINAYGRAVMKQAEGLINELTLTSCYGFIERCCDIVLQYLSIMQKQSECPDECKEAVSSLMFAAARFPKLPELRDIRDAFQERYRNFLECFVNQGFVENVSSKPSTLEMKVLLMQDIATEFSIKWDSNAFQKRMSTPPSSALVQPKHYGSPHAHDQKSRASRGVKHDVSSKDRAGDIVDGNRLYLGKQADLPRRTDLNLHFKQEVSSNGYKPHNGREETIMKRGEHEVLLQGRGEFPSQKNDKLNGNEDTSLKTNGAGYSSHRGKKEFNSGLKLHDYEDNTTIDRDHQYTSPYAKPDMSLQERREVPVEKHANFNGNEEDDALKTNRVCSSNRKKIESVESGIKLHDYRDNIDSNRNSQYSSYAKPHIFPGSTGFKGNGVDLSSVNNVTQPNIANSVKEVQVDGMQKLKPHCSPGLPPPYVKPNVKPKDGKNGTTLGYLEAGFDGYLVPKVPSAYNTTSTESRSEGIDLGANHLENEGQITGPASASSHGLKKDHHPDDGRGHPLSKPRSSRRRRSKSRPIHEDVGDLEDPGAVKRRPRSRRKDDSRRGLQVLFDDEQDQNDEEERIIDKLLIHYSKKPSDYDPGKVRRKSKSRVHEQGADVGKCRGSRGGPDEMPDTVPPVRSISLPHEPTGTSKVTKGFSRAASFQPDRSNPARHVHPKLPDYDDLAARFAALKGR